MPLTTPQAPRLHKLKGDFMVVQLTRAWEAVKGFICKALGNQTAAPASPLSSPVVNQVPAQNRPGSIVRNVVFGHDPRADVVSGGPFLSGCA